MSKLTMTQFHPFIRSFNLYIIADERTKSQQGIGRNNTKKTFPLPHPFTRLDERMNGQHALKSYKESKK